MAWLSVPLLAIAGSAQVPTRPETRDPPAWGKIVRTIHILPTSIPRAQVLVLLKTKEGHPLRKVETDQDLVTLFKVRKYRAEFTTRKVDDQHVDLFIDITPSVYFESCSFGGMTHLTEQQARLLTGLRGVASENDVERARLLIRDKYREDGYYFASVEKVVKQTTKAGRSERDVTLMVDEGPQVLVRSLVFRGNASFPGEVFLRYGDNLQGSAKLECVPGVFYGNPFSKWKVQDDIEKVELFYRRQGFLNCEVHLEGQTFSRDRSRVDLAYRVIEGERFKVVAVEIEVRRSEDPGDKRLPLYSAEVLGKEIALKVGDFYSSEVVNRDKASLERFYGKRGHPTARRYGRQLPNLFNVFEPSLVFHESKPEVRVIYKVVEGEPKRVRDVRVFGNTHTLDRVVRRHIKVLPGEVLDVSLLDRSRYLLDRTRFFTDPRSLSGVRIQLQPIEGRDEEVDVEVRVKEGETGRFQWGAGYSTGNGLIGTFQFQKRNFDISRLPSSWNPGTWFEQIASGKAFHGGGQELDLFLSPGTQISTFRLSWIEPDLFREHMDTIGLRTDGYRTLRLMDSYNTDTLGVGLTLTRMFDENTSLQLGIRDEVVNIRRIDNNAPLLIWDNEGKSRIRAVRLTYSLQDLDDLWHPRSGYNLSTHGEIAGGMLGADEDFWKVGITAEYYRPFYADSLDRKHVIYTKLVARHADTYGSTKDLYPSERYFMGGSTLRGFDQRRAGPSQFGEPLGGKTLLTSTIEYQFPLVSTQMEGATIQTEIIRGVVFTDFGLLGLDYNDRTFREPRLTIGFGVRIQVPVLQVPIQLDLAWPLLAEQTDREQQLFFSFRRF
ncbi:MAG: BamA/TamA family outer membrane protein [Planctomycetes bacterium]|nr:BamA/TamA family outer membrane protein [Planctomycetota bacterium]